MTKSIDVTAMGELLIDYTQAGFSKKGLPLFEQNPGGAPANCLTALSHMGFKTSFIGKVGDDMQGRFLIDTLKAESISTTGIIKDKNSFTTLAFVAIDDNTGEREFAFARKPGADTCLRFDEVKKSILDKSKILHVGGLSLTDEPMKSTLIESIKYAKKAGAVITYDPNYRPALWSSKSNAKKEMSKILKYTDIIKVSDEEAYIITGKKDMQKAAAELLKNKIKIAVITLGKGDAYIASKSGMKMIKGYKVKAIDTTGAGDSFFGGFLSILLVDWKKLTDYTIEELAAAADYGNATAALCVTKRGGIPAVPYPKDIIKLMKA